MSKLSQDGVRVWLAAQVSEFMTVRSAYEEYSVILDGVLTAASKRVAPMALVKTRVKSVASFCEKAIRKFDEFQHPVQEFTDLCGARVIARTRNEVDALCRMIKATFEIDEANSIDTSERLGAAEFGYRSVHYIVSIPRENSFGIDVPEQVFGLRAEVQVRTMTEHAWADFDHDLSYKGAFPLPRLWKRQLATLAAELEDADEAIARIETGLREYSASLGAYVRRDEMPEQLAFLELVAEHDPDNPDLAWRIAKFAAALGEWEKAVAVLSPHVDPNDLMSASQPVVRDLGVAICKLNPPGSESFNEGQRLLTFAGEPSILNPGGRDSDALASLAGTWKASGDHHRAKQLYLDAFEIDPTNSYPLVNYIAYELIEKRRLDSIAPLRPAVRAAVARRRRQAAVGMDRPWSSFDIGFLSLLLGDVDESLDAYALGVRAAGDDWEIEASLETLDQISAVEDELVGYRYAHKLLQIGAAVRFPDADRLLALSAFATPQAQPLRGPIVIVAGTTAEWLEREVQEYRDLLLEAFAGFRGTVISAGTTQGISDLVGDLGSREPQIDTVGYMPRRFDERRSGTTVDADERRFRELRFTEGDDFSPLEPLQTWADLCVSGISVEQVALIGIGGGSIAAFEYRLALALNARVAIIEGSGREAGRLLSNPDWSSAKTLHGLPPVAQSLRAFLDELEAVREES